MNNQKICNFFVSENHLLTVVLPYINEKILENKKIALVLEKDLCVEVKEYLKKVRSLNFENERILKLEWKRTNIEKINIEEKDIIIVVGNAEYVENVNENIDLENKEVINCYKINNIEEIDNILENYTKILNTEGIKSIGKISQNIQKKKIIKTQI